MEDDAANESTYDYVYSETVYFTNADDREDEFVEVASDASHGEIVLAAA